MGWPYLRAKKRWSLTWATSRIFIKHNVHKDFSLYLNRRHFDLEPGESLVECGAIATPWPLREVDDALKDKIAAKSWAFFDDKLLPFEFSFDPEVKRPQHNVVPSLFIDELGGFLRTHNLAGQFGITKMDPSISLEESRSMIETNIGRVSVLVPKNDLEGGVANVGWQFDLDGNKVVRGCKYCCSVHG